MFELYVGNLDYGTTAEDLRMVFSSFGRIQNVWVAQNPPGYAFVGFENEIDAQLAWQQMDGQHLHNRRIKVNTSFRHNQKRSPLGFQNKEQLQQHAIHTLPRYEGGYGYDQMGMRGENSVNDCPRYRSNVPLYSPIIGPAHAQGTRHQSQQWNSSLWSQQQAPVITNRQLPSTYTASPEVPQRELPFQYQQVQNLHVQNNNNTSSGDLDFSVRSSNTTLSGLNVSPWDSINYGDIAGEGTSTQLGGVGGGVGGRGVEGGKVDGRVGSDAGSGGAGFVIRELHRDSPAIPQLSPNPFW